MAAYTQDKRFISLSLPSLGKDVLLLTGFHGREEMSRLFRYELEMLSANAAIAAKDVVGKAVTWQVKYAGDKERYFNGHVSRFSAGPMHSRDLRIYRAEVVPWLWFLTRTRDCRIFQNKTAPEVIEQIFKDAGFTHFEPGLKATYVKREYCVQYRETDCDFVSRLMEEEGIFYFFRHEKDKHVLIYADQKAAYKDCPEKEVEYSVGNPPTSHLSSWEHGYEFRPGKWAATDYNFETPSTNLMTSSTTVVKLTGNDKFEVYDYPGEYAKKADGEALVKVRMEEEEAEHDVVSAGGNCTTFTVGGKFTLKKHDCTSESGKAYAITAIEHSGSDQSYTGGGQSYANTFRCIPDSVTFRPARTTPRPVVQGPQTAIVVGPKGEEIYTDKYGRVKVQFHWDREGKKDENSSCWIRVAENWAGKNWGIVFNPRIGQEVIVDFLEGNPDQPIITGRVYNAEQMPPYELPAKQTQSVLKTRSSKQGGTDHFNELRFEDKKDSEEIYFHAEKDFNRVVENNDTLKVGFEKKDKGDQTMEIFNNQTTKIGTKDASDGSQAIEVFNNQSLKVGAGAGQAKNGSQTIEIYKDRTETVKTGNETVTIDKGNRTITVKEGNDTHKVSKGNREVTIEMGNDTLTISKGNQTVKLDVGKSETEATQSIELKVGQSSIKLEPTKITIKSLMVSVQADTTMDVKGLTTTVDGSATCAVSGGMITIG